MKRALVVFYQVVLAVLVICNWHSITDAFSNSLPEVQAALITFAAVATGFTYVHAAIKNKQTDTRQFAEKHGVYSGFIQTVFEVMQGMRDGSQNEAEAIKKILKFKQDVLVWGSPDVIKAYNEFDLSMGGDVLKTLRAMDNVYRALRKDLGHDNTFLDGGELTGIFLDQTSKVELKKSYQPKWVQTTLNILNRPL